MVYAGNGSVPPASQTKQAAQPNGRAVVGQQWQPPQNLPVPSSAKPMPQDLPAIETVKMSSELRVGTSPASGCQQAVIPSAVSVMWQLSDLSDFCVVKSSSLSPCWSQLYNQNVGLQLGCDQGAGQHVGWQAYCRHLVTS